VPLLVASRLGTGAFVVVWWFRWFGSSGRRVNILSNIFGVYHTGADRRFCALRGPVTVFSVPADTCRVCCHLPRHYACWPCARCLHSKTQRHSPRYGTGGGWILFGERAPFRLRFVRRPPPPPSLSLGFRGGGRFCWWFAFHGRCSSFLFQFYCTWAERRWSSFWLAHCT